MCVRACRKVLMMDPRSRLRVYENARAHKCGRGCELLAPSHFYSPGGLCMKMQASAGSSDKCIPPAACLAVATGRNAPPQRVARMINNFVTTADAAVTTIDVEKPWRSMAIKAHINSQNIVSYMKHSARKSTFHSCGALRRLRRSTERSDYLHRLLHPYWP